MRRALFDETDDPPAMPKVGDKFLAPDGKEYRVNAVVGHTIYLEGRIETFEVTVGFSKDPAR